ncbi:MAG: bacteriohemerythrin [Oscillospiraceae bacterium]|nr:bacteriohemerythrin [Oscillospiraceae bacterium]
MTFTWSDDLLVGDETIDSQHKQLVDRYNSLVLACVSGKAIAELEIALNFLADYTVAHFSYEETLQRELEFADYPRHKQLHDGFTQTVKDLINQLQDSGATLGLTYRLSTRIGNWLINHIKQEDTKVGQLIRSKLV